ncbi:glycosyltransferase family 1 protein [Candidatus Saccharibacteria bacterium]|nr:MAG: glycosyltransferase family 1 protein [Candidatus Saccharibacteria bacterium]
MSHKKVLFTSHTANFQKFNRPFMRMLSKQGYEVHYASMGEEEILDCDRSFTVPFTRSPFRLGNIKAYKQLKRIIDRENYDIIHTHTPMGSVVTRLAARDARKKGTRVIYTAHGFHFFKGAPLANWLVYYPVERYMARHTDTLITINGEDFKRAKRVFKTDVRYVPGVGVDESKFEPRLTEGQRNDLRRTFGIKPDDFVMIYPAELSKRKRQIWLINALASFIKTHPDVHLLLPGGDSLGGKCQRLTSKLGFDRQIHFLGYRHDIPQLMMIADLSVSSSSQEGLPVTLLEALVAELPIIATDSRGHADLVKNSVNGYVVDRNNPQDFRQKTRTVYSDDSLRQSMKRRASGQLKGYRMEDVIPQTSEAYIL